MENKVERKPRDYKNGKIYCLRNYLNDEIYIGSTCQSLSRRMAYHRQDSIKQNRQRILIYKTMTELGRDNFYIELIEEYPCENLSQLTRREGELTRELKASLNQKIAGRTPEEFKLECPDKIKISQLNRRKRYNEKNQEKVKVYVKEYYKQNQETILENRRRYRELHKEDINKKKREYYINNREKMIERDRQYKEMNREKIKENNKKYRDNNKDKIKEANRKQYEKRKLQNSQPEIADLD